MRLHLSCLIAVTLVSSIYTQGKGHDPAFKKVSKKISLGTYTPKDLISFQGVKVSQRIVRDLERLLSAAQKDGVTLKVISGYRSYEYQKDLFNRYIKNERAKNPKLTQTSAAHIVNTYSAKPGHSEHQLGTTVDVLSAENNYAFTVTPELKYIVWLEKHASKFNFVISYPKDGTEYIYEPWHIRWYPPSNET